MLAGRCWEKCVLGWRLGWVEVGFVEGKEGLLKLRAGKGVVALEATVEAWSREGRESRAPS